MIKDIQEGCDKRKTSGDVRGISPQIKPKILYTSNISKLIAFENHKKVFYSLYPKTHTKLWNIKQVPQHLTHICNQ